MIMLSKYRVKNLMHDNPLLAILAFGLIFVYECQGFKQTTGALGFPPLNFFYPD